MATDILPSTTPLVSNLESELQKAKATLRGVEDNIKRVFGKEASELNSFQQSRGRKSHPQTNRSFQSDDNGYGNKANFPFPRRSDSFYTEGMNEKPVENRRRSENFNFNRLGPSARGPGGENQHNDNSFNNDPPLRKEKRLQSEIVSSVKEKSREEVMAEQSGDRSGRDRNKRMFGSLLGTLHKFKQDESKLKTKEEKRAQIEAKLEEAAKQERESVKKEKQDLILERKKKLTEIKRLEIKKRRVQELDEWEERTRTLRNFIRTDTKPHIFYLPKTLDPQTECRLEDSRILIDEMIANKRKEVMSELQFYEERSIRYWDNKIEGRESKRFKPTQMDEDIEDELRELIKNEDDYVISTSKDSVQDRDEKLYKNESLISLNQKDSLDVEADYQNTSSSP